MITIRRSEDRGHANHGWLQAKHTFSFAEYYDPAFMNFGVLRVLNQDRVEPARGFGTHGHKDMEIVTVVLQGVLEHKDSMGNGSQMRPGDVQLMSAGSGVTHSEFNASETEPLHLLQMWVIPAATGTRPRYEQKAFSEAERRGVLRLVVDSEGADGALTIGQDVRLFTGLFEQGDAAQVPIPADRAGWLHVAEGSVRLGEHELHAGDAAAITGESALTLHGVEAANVVLWDLPSA